MAEAHRSPLPLADLAFNHLLSAAAMGHGDKDWGAIALALQAQAGIATGSSGVSSKDGEGKEPEGQQ